MKQQTNDNNNHKINNNYNNIVDITYKAKMLTIDK
jgi:hypothetical protein